MSSRRLEDIPSRRLHNMSSRRLQDMSSRRLEDVLKTSWNMKNCYAEDVLKTSSGHVLKTSGRNLEDQEMFAGKVANSTCAIKKNEIHLKTY